MAPSAETTHATAATSSSSSTSTPKPKRRSLSSSLSRKTIAFAVNYEPSIVDRYWTSPTPPPPIKAVAPLPETTPERTTRRSRRASATTIVVPAEENTPVEPTSAVIVPPAPTTPVVATPVVPPQILEDDVDPSGNRRSTREQKQRPVPLTRVRVRYDMEMVPSTQKSLQDSVVWYPRTRKDWEESISELTAVCTSATSRKLPPGKPLVPPLSRDYIRDRIDIDDPMRGYQIRNAQGGWLQGFLIWTNFTTWTHFFTWDSKHEQAGLLPHAANPSIQQDNDGSLAQELQDLPRQGNPSDSGIVFPNVAEIALLGGLRCGGTLLRMALEDIRKYPQYKYVALQATDGSKKFYEHFGFKRVGAVCRYGSSVTEKGMQSHSLVAPTLETPVSGYRHWTHANEAPESLNLHGGPSYMMCLKLDETVPKTSLLDYIKPYTVEDKPLIRALGAASTPAPKAQPQPHRKSKSKIVHVTGKRVHLDSRIEPGSKRQRKMSVTDENTAPKGPAKVTPKTPKKVVKSSKLSTPPSAPSLHMKPQQRPVEPSNKIQKVDRTVLCKQKVKSYPRDRAHFYNKVVQPSTGEANYFFVLHYSEPLQQLTLVPMKATGTLSGKRQGRPRFQCLVQPTSANWLTAQPCQNYIPVPAFMVMKTPIVAQEAWDILGADG